MSRKLSVFVSGCASGILRQGCTSKGTHTFTTTAVHRLTAFQKQKILTEFSVVYDRNKDGFIDSVDIEHYKKALTDYYALSRGQNLTKMPIGYDDYWTLFNDVADENDDGKLSRPEWLDIWTRISAEARKQSFSCLPQWVRLMPYVIFPIMDVKADGVIDPDEYRNFWYHVGGIKSDPAQIQHCMNVMTENGAHVLNMMRFQALYADFYLSKDAQSPGRYICGPIEYTGE